MLQFDSNFSTDLANVQSDVNVDRTTSSQFDYTFCKEIGNGISSNVYKARHPIHGVCAIKEIFPEYSKYLDIEVDFLQRFHHENIIPILDSWKNNSYAYIAMPLLDGNVYELLQNGMSDEVILDCVTQLLEAVAQLHDKNLVHFDLKAENIGFKIHPEGQIQFMLLDFGSAEELNDVMTDSFQDDVHSGNILVTSLFHRAPECSVWGYRQLISEASDMWSVGCIIYELVTHTILLEELDEYREMEYNQKVVKKAIHLAERFVPITREQTLLKKIMMKCLIEDPNERYKAFELIQMIELE